MSQDCQNLLGLSLLPHLIWSIGEISGDMGGHDKRFAWIASKKFKLTVKKEVENILLEILDHESVKVKKNTYLYHFLNTVYLKFFFRDVPSSAIIFSKENRDTSANAIGCHSTFQRCRCTTVTVAGDAQSLGITQDAAI